MHVFARVKITLELVCTEEINLYNPFLSQICAIGILTINVQIVSKLQSHLILLT